MEYRQKKNIEKRKKKKKLIKKKKKKRVMRSWRKRLENDKQGKF